MEAARRRAKGVESTQPVSSAVQHLFLVISKTSVYVFLVNPKFISNLKVSLIKRAGARKTFKNYAFILRKT